MDNNFRFRKAAKLTKKWFREDNNIYYHLYTSNGDQALMSKYNANATEYAPKKKQ